LPAWIRCHLRLSAMKWLSTIITVGLFAQIRAYSPSLKRQCIQTSYRFNTNYIYIYIYRYIHFTHYIDATVSKFTFNNDPIRPRTPCQVVRFQNWTRRNRVRWDHMCLSYKCSDSRCEKKIGLFVGNVMSNRRMRY